MNNSANNFIKQIINSYNAADLNTLSCRMKALGQTVVIIDTIKGLYASGSIRENRENYQDNLVIYVVNSNYLIENVLSTRGRKIKSEYCLVISTYGNSKLTRQISEDSSFMTTENIIFAGIQTKNIGKADTYSRNTVTDTKVYRIRGTNLISTFNSKANLIHGATEVFVPYKHRVNSYEAFIRM